MSLEILEYNYSTTWNLDQVNLDTINNNNYPIVFGNFTGTNPEIEPKVWAEFLAGKKRGRPSEVVNVSSYLTLHMQIAKQFGSTRATFGTQGTCATSLYSLYTAMLVSQDQNTPVIVFCADNLNVDFWRWAYNSYGALDQTTGRPFDDTSRGFRMGQGWVAFLVRHSSVKSVHTVQSVIQRFHFYSNPQLLANPGTSQDLIANLDKVDFNSADLYNAHATGTPIGDIVEYEFVAQNIKHNVPIIAYKGHVGHCISAAGGIEIAMALDDCKQGILRPNNIHGNKIVDDPRIITEPTAFTFKRMIKSSFGFGGRAAVIEMDLR